MGSKQSDGAMDIHIEAQEEGGSVHQDMDLLTDSGTNSQTRSFLVIHFHLEKPGTFLDWQPKVSSPLAITSVPL